MNGKLENILAELKAAFTRFQDVMRQEKNEYIRDSAIQRFEFTFELTWKVMKAYLEEKGLKVYSPRDAIRGAFQHRIIPNDLNWIKMLEIRNETTHLYNEAMAERVYAELSKYLPLIESLIKELT